MTKTTKPPIADLIARTPGAQTREEAKASLKARRDQLLSSTSVPPSDPAATEPMPDIDSEAYARHFFTRLAEKEKNSAPPRPPRGSKPRLVTKDDEPPKTS
jgi:hypothetical protein